MVESKTPERRVFLRVLGAAAATWASSACGGETTGGTTSGHASSSGAGGAGGSGGMGGAGGSCGVGTSVGDASLFANSGIHQVAETSVLICRDSGGIYALSSICTHRGCNMNFDGALIFGGIRCTCHGSEFGLAGQVLQGPAFSPLVAFAVTLSCGQLWVDTSQVVPASQRLVV
jgi:Rieske Fe-S protein